MRLLVGMQAVLALALSLLKEEWPECRHLFWHGATHLLSASHLYTCIMPSTYALRSFVSDLVLKKFVVVGKTSRQTQSLVQTCTGPAGNCKNIQEETIKQKTAYFH